MGRLKGKSKDATSAPKNGRRTWTTEDQGKFLENYIPAYLAAKSSGTLGEFWPYAEWASRWPLVDATPQEIADGLTDEDRTEKQELVSATL